MSEQSDISPIARKRPPRTIARTSRPSKRPTPPAETGAPQPTLPPFLPEVHHTTRDLMRRLAAMHPRTHEQQIADLNQALAKAGLKIKPFKYDPRDYDDDPTDPDGAA